MYGSIPQGSSTTDVATNSALCDKVQDGHVERKEHKVETTKGKDVLLL